MKKKLLLLNFALAVLGFKASAQDDGFPNYMLADQLKIMIRKVGLPIDSAVVYMEGFNMEPITKPTEIAFSSYVTDGVVITFETNDAGRIELITATMPTSFLITANKFFDSMGMMEMGIAAPPGYTAYANWKYVAFINPQVKEGVLSLMMLLSGY